MMLVVFGPTAAGKTNLAINLAKRFNAELISADSRQVYKGLDIGSGKVTKDLSLEKHKGYWIVDGIKIHGFDLVKPGQSFSVADFLKAASDTMIRVTVSKKLPIVVGGTGFYIKALLDGIDTVGIKPNPRLRSRLEKLTTSELYQKLLKIDKKRAIAFNQSDRHNPRRLIRAIEVAISKRNLTMNYEPLTRSAFAFGESDMNFRLIGLTAPNEYLYKLADQSIEKRLDQGLVQEIQSLLKKGVDVNWLESLGLEYRWITKAITGKINLKDATNSLKGDAHSFIRRQKSWFKKFSNIELFDITKSGYQNAIEKRVAIVLKAARY